MSQTEIHVQQIRQSELDEFVRTIVREELDKRLEHSRAAIEQLRAAVAKFATVKSRDLSPYGGAHQELLDALNAAVLALGEQHD